MSNKKKKKAGKLEAEGSKIVEKQASKEKGRVLLVLTLIACVLPMLLGVQLWAQIPEMVPSGRIGAEGVDDSIPRWMVVFGMPGLMCLTNLIAHFMLRLNHKRRAVPPLVTRLVGRWGFSVLSVIFCGGMMFEAAGQSWTMTFLISCILSLALMMLGGHMWDCPMDAKIALRFSFTEHNKTAWKQVHRFASWLWMITGLIVIGATMVTAGSTIYSAALILLALLAPFIYGKNWTAKLN